MRRFPISTLMSIALLVLPAAAPAFTFLDLATGDEAPLPDARSIAMGRTRLAAPTGAFTGATNPALLAGLDGTSISLGGNVLKLKETRSIPAFDSFDGYLVESAYVLNDEYQWEGGFAAATSLGGERMPFPAGFGVSWAPVRDFQYAYTEEVRDNNAFTQPRDGLIALNEIQGDGVLGAWTFAFGLNPFEPLAVGFSLEFLKGDQDVAQRTRWMQIGTVDETSIAIDGLSGVREVAALSYSPSHRLDLALVWRNETNLDGDFVRAGDQDALAHLGVAADPERPSGSLGMTLPEEWSIGAAFRPQAKTATSVQFDATLTEWSDYENGMWEDMALDDVWDVRLGIEHVFYNGLPTRFGFHYRPSPRNDEITTTAFTFGAGLIVGPFVTDVAFEIATRDYRAEDVFDDSLFGGNSRSGTDLIEEVGSSAFLTMTYTLD